ncbi:MAG: aldo/keto reductase [Candidatus Eisenbacteria bacterium]|nr:aldo/keto reductase [Candidatus Eisenbacteria bacterium]MCC7141452.1 aldo/keto reductase [Candidatus Eisenbacteria bacterium]
MQYRRLGGTGLKVSPLCLGAMMFGRWGNPDHDESIRIIHRALDAGINFIDTANVYSEGESEEIVAKAIAGKREQVVLATKAWGAMGPGPNQRGLSRKAILEQCEASLRRLKVEAIDLYQIHRPDPTTPWEETLGALTDLVRQGKVRYLGCSSNHYDTEGQRRLPAWEIVETFWLSERSRFERFVCFQPPYSILRRTMEAEIFPMSLRFGLANIVWSPLEGGWLTGKYRLGGQNPLDSPRASGWVGDINNPRFVRRLEIVEELVKLAASRNVPLAELAVAWSLVHPGVTSSIIGPRTMEQLEGNIRALDLTLDAATLAEIDRLVPPGTSAL